MNSDSIVQDATGFSGVKRPGLICRYFLNNGDCFYGSNCQYLHEIPAASALSTADALTQANDEGCRRVFYFADHLRYVKRR